VARTIDTASSAQVRAEGEALTLEQATDLALAALEKLSGVDAVERATSASGEATHKG
jgi:hypothetical protein